MRGLIISLVVVFPVFQAFPLLAAEAAFADAARTCAACHGAEGGSPNPLWPDLAGQKKGYLLKQLRAFRSGERKDPLMGPVARTLSDREMEALAEQYSGMARR